MRKRADDGEGSLELLLDTICNMFGGIVLIAILLALLSGASNEEAPSEDPTHLQELIKQRKQVLPECQVQAVKKMDELTNKMDALLTQLEQLQPEVDETEIHVQQQRAERDELETETLRKRNELETLTRRLRKIRAPIAKDAGDREPVLAAIRYGRFFPIDNVAKAAGGERGYDPTSVKVSQTGMGSDTRDHFTLIRGAGQAVQPGCELGGAVSQALRNVSKTGEYLDIWVYPDSYAEFNYIKKHLIRREIQYNWQPCTEGEQPNKTSGRIKINN